MRTARALAPIRISSNTSALEVATTRSTPHAIAFSSSSRALGEVSASP